MSEIAEAAAPAAAVEDVSAPQSTQDLAATVIQEAEGSIQESPGVVEREEPPGVAPVADPPKELSVEEQLLAEFGFKDAKRPDGREHYISRSKVLQMIGSGLKRGQARWDGERTAIETERTALRGHLEQLRAGVSGDPKAFLSELASHDPRYKAFLEPQAAPVAPQAQIADMPKPNVPLGDGSFTYDVEGIQKLIEWAVDAKMMPKVDERLKPYAERVKDEEERAQTESQRAALRTSTQQQMTEAQSWPGFGTLAADNSLTPFQQEVLTELANDTAKARAANRRPTMTLRQAYLEVHARQLAADDTAKRAKWIEESNAAPRSTSVTRGGAESTRPRGPRSTEEIAREQIQRLGA
jgi:hypothetical protein